jgi:hypothetical protein
MIWQLVTQCYSHDILKPYCIANCDVTLLVAVTAHSVAAQRVK